MSDYEHLHVRIADRVAFATVHAPPTQVMVAGLYRDLAAFGAAVAADDAVGCVVLRSDDPDFFVAHFDVELLVDRTFEAEPERPTELRHFHRMVERYRSMPKPTIAELNGRTGGGGMELALACDMRFGAIGKTVMCQMEVPLGILPGGGGTQHLARLVGRGRAAEIVLGGGDIDAETAERWGLLNRALPAEDLRPFVTDLATRIAGFPPVAVANAKASLLAADEELGLVQGLLEEDYRFQVTERDPEAQRRMRRFLEVGGQTREGELDLQATLDRL